MTSDELHPSIEALRPILGRWQTSGVVLDEHGVETTRISGFDTYGSLPGGRWIAHDVDVLMGEQETVAHEVIGGSHPAGGWNMYAFDPAAEQTNVMRLTDEQNGLLLLHGEGVRSWFDSQVGTDQMATKWERLIDDEWIPWMSMQFDRSPGGSISRT